MMDIDPSWSVTILDPTTRVKGARFAISETFLTLSMNRELRGFYAYGQCLEKVVGNSASEEPFISSLVGIAGAGVGYGTAFPTPSDAARYFSGVGPPQPLSNLLQPRKEKDWRDCISGTGDLSIIRDLYELNIWPNYFVERVRAHEFIYDRIVAEGAEFRELPCGAFLVRLPQARIESARILLRQFLFIKPNPS